MVKPEDLSLILLTRNGGSLFSEVLESLGRCAGIERAEVLVIDSGSSDGTAERAAAFPRARVLRIPPADFGHGRTRNLGARQTSRPILVYLVQDATPLGEDFLTRLSAPLEVSEVAAVYGRQIARRQANPVERYYLHSVYPEAPRVLAGGGPGPVRIREIFFSNVCSAIRRSAWERHPFDETLVMSEDQQWAKAVLRAGQRIVYEPAAAVLHSHHYTLRTFFQRNFDSGASLVGIAQDTPRQLIAYELRHLATGCRELARHRKAHWLPYLFAFESARVAGFAAGRQAHHLPPALTRRLGQHKDYWRRGA